MHDNHEENDVFKVNLLDMERIDFSMTYSIYEHSGCKFLVTFDLF